MRDLNRRQRKAVKAAIRTRKAQSARPPISPRSSEGNHSQPPADHRTHDDQDNRGKLLGLSAGQWVSLIFTTGFAAFLNHISSSPNVLYFSALTVCSWVLWQIRS